ncbi:MAG TPA: hypothetical protein VL134_11945 [Leptolyngbya sp.]|jgi:hypothetical protein|nr:hypothetical protein [Leptolyngbya sp.]
MPVKTRGSAQIDKAQRRIALIKSIEENLDLGYNLTVPNYAQLIEETRSALEDYNTLLPQVAEARQKLEALEKELGATSERMLSGVAMKFGKSSIEYTKAGGKVRQRAKSLNSESMEESPLLTIATNGSTSSNGKAIKVN